MLRRAAFDARQGQRQEGQILIAYREADLGEVDRIERRDGLAAVDELSRVDALAAHATVEGRGHARPLQVPLGAGDPRCRLAQRRPGDRQPVQGIVVAGLADGLRLPQLLVALVAFLGVLEFTLRGGQVGAGSLEGDLVVHPLDLDENVAPLEEAARYHRSGHGQDPAGHFGDQVALGLGYHDAVRRDRHLNGPRIRRHRAHHRNVRWRRHRLDLRTAHEDDRGQRQTGGCGKNGCEESADHLSPARDRPKVRSHRQDVNAMVLAMFDGRCQPAQQAQRQLVLRQARSSFLVEQRQQVRDIVALCRR